MEIMRMSGRRSTSAENDENVSNYFNRYPTRSIRRAKIDVQRSRRAIKRILWKRVSMYLYKIDLVPRFEHVKYQVQLNYVILCLQNL